MEDRGYRAMDEENYYSSIRSYTRFLAPFYDMCTIFIPGLRSKVVDFADARKGSRILDVGTGTGKQAFAFAKRGFDITGIDLFEEMIKIAKKNNEYENAKLKSATLQIYLLKTTASMLLLYPSLYTT